MCLPECFFLRFDVYIEHFANISVNDTVPNIFPKKRVPCNRDFSWFVSCVQHFSKQYYKIYRNVLKRWSAVIFSCYKVVQIHYNIYWDQSRELWEQTIISYLRTEGLTTVKPRNMRQCALLTRWYLPTSSNNAQLRIPTSLRSCPGVSTRIYQQEPRITVEDFIVRFRKKNLNSVPSEMKLYFSTA